MSAKLPNEAEREKHHEKAGFSLNIPDPDCALIEDAVEKEAPWIYREYRRYNDLWILLQADGYGQISLRAANFFIS